MVAYGVFASYARSEEILSLLLEFEYAGSLGPLRSPRISCPCFILGRQIPH